MKESFRQSMAWLHTWSGLVVAWILYFVFMTGTAGYFDEEITRWMQPEGPIAKQVVSYSGPDAVGRAQAILAAEAPVADLWSIDPSWERTDHNWSLSWTNPPQPGVDEPAATKGERRRDRRERLVFDPTTGVVQSPGDRPEVRETDGGLGLYRLHYRLHYIPENAAILIVGFCTMLMLLAILSGVVTHKKIFKDFFTFRPGKGQRSWLDMHNIVSVTALPFFLMITYSGLLFFMYATMPATMHVAYGMDHEWPNDGYSNPLNPRTNNRFDGMEAENGERRRLSGNAPSDAARAPMVDLAPLAAQVERRWGKGTIGGISIEHPGHSDARVTFIFLDNGVVRNIRRRVLFDGVTGADLSPPPFRQGATWKVQNIFIALHEGLFAGPLLRWIYFLSGLLGCAMIATGLILWTVKRRQKQRGAGDDVLFRLVEILNIGTLTGLPLGVAAYFWANRLLPAGLEGRATWEYHSLFVAMGAAFIGAAVIRPARKAWQWALWTTAAVFLLLPLLNAITTDRHLGVTIAAGDWGLAGFDGTMLALGGLFALAALKMQDKTAVVAARIQPVRSMEAA